MGIEVNRPFRHYSTVKPGDIVHAHGVPFVVTDGPITYPSSCIGGTATYFVGTYRGPDLSQDRADNPLTGFVNRDGDTWTFQRYTDGALLWQDEDGNWNQGS